MDIRNWLATALTDPPPPGVVVTLQPSQEGLFDFFRTRRPDFSNPEGPELHQKNQKALKKTYLNPAWLGRQKYREGLVSLGKETRLLTDRGKVPTDMLKLLERTVAQHRQQLEAHYRAIQQLSQKASPIREVLTSPRWEKSLTEEVYQSIAQYAKVFDRPPEARAEFDAGGLSLRRHPVSSMADVYEATMPTQVTGLPALDADGVKRAAELILELFELSDQEYELMRECWAYFFETMEISPSFSNPVPASNPWHELLKKIDNVVNPGFSPLYYIRDAHIRAIGQLIDRSVK